MDVKSLPSTHIRPIEIISGTTTTAHSRAGKPIPEARGDGLAGLLSSCNLGLQL